MSKRSPLNLVFALPIAVALLSPSELMAQPAGSTKFRGISVNQTVAHVKRAMIADGFHIDPGSTRAQVKAMDGKKNTCAEVRFKRGRSVSLRLSPCFFRLDSRISATDFGQAIVDHFPIDRLNVGSRVNVDVVSYPARRYQVNYYYGRVATGEKIEIMINDGRYITQENYEGFSPQVTVSVGDGAGAPVFK